MSYINVGARPAIHATAPNGLRPKEIKTKKALRELLSQDPTSVVFYGTSPFTPFSGTVLDLTEGTTLTVTGPDPHTARNWGANIKIKDGKVIMDNKPIKAVARERETVWCEAHGDQPHFENDTCQHPHLTDQATRARMNAEAAKV